MCTDYQLVTKKSLHDLHGLQGLHGFNDTPSRNKMKVIKKNF